MRNLIRTILVAVITWEARLVLKKYKPRIIAITGSVGKTSTKDAIYAALESSLYVRKSKKSFNSEFGVPLTILGCDSAWNNPVKWLQNIFEGFMLIVTPNHYPRWLVLEVGTDHPGDITAITRWLKPDVVVVTSLPDVPVHVENFNAPEDVVKEKRALVRALKSGGTLVVCGDDKNTLALTKEFAQFRSRTYGVEAHNDVAASHILMVYDANEKPIGMTFQVEEADEDVSLQLFGRIGQQQMYPVLAAFAVAHVVDISPLTAARELEKQEGTPGRMRLLDGYNASTIIDDTYNSSPIALRAALATLKKIETRGKKIAVLGDMLELGRFSVEAHKKAGVQVSSIADVLVTVGVRAKGIAQAAREAGFDPECMYEFDTSDSKEAGRTVRAMLEAHDIVLVKGSQSIRLEKAVKEMLAEPAKAKELLVRQDDEWLLR